MHDIKELGLSKRMENSLRRAGINSIELLECIDLNELKKYKNIGKSTVDNLYTKLLMYKEIEDLDYKIKSLKENFPNVDKELKDILSAFRKSIYKFKSIKQNYLLEDPTETVDNLYMIKLTYETRYMQSDKPIYYANISIYCRENKIYPFEFYCNSINDLYVKLTEFIVLFIKERQ
jgi:predicted nuclease with TOPRIM domain